MKIKARTKAPSRPTRRKRSWRDVPDEIILALTPPSAGGRAASLSPDMHVTWGYVLGDPRCTAIIDAWQFSYPITVVAI
jgi:hypothetical protein